MQKNNSKIVLSSIGIISALGIGLATQLEALKGGRSGLRLSKYLQSKLAADFQLGEVPFSDHELAEILEIPTHIKGYTRTTLLAIIAVKQMVDEIGIGFFKDKKIAFINANTVGGMSSVENHYDDFLLQNSDPTFFPFISTIDCAESTQNLIRYFNFNVISTTLSTACSSSANALILGERLIQAGIVDYAICGGSDALSRFTLNGFHSLKNVSKTPCQPFDNNRLGLNLGEGAAYVLLEKEATALKRDTTIQAVFSGYNNSNDAYHPTAPKPDGSGAYQTMYNALKKANLETKNIDYINAHGTATLNNDSAEGLAIEKLFIDKVPAFSSTKPFTGHTLAAAGVIEAVFSVLAIQNSFVPPNLNFLTPMDELKIMPTTEKLIQPIQHVLSNSFGFGGNNVSLILSKYCS